MKDWLDGVNHRPLTFEDTLPPLHPNACAVMHTNGGGADLYDYFNQHYARTHERICSHFQVYRDGHIDQFVRTSRVAFAAFDSNTFAWQIETEDDGNPDTPLTPAQIDALNWLVTQLGVPRVVASEAGHGVGWHCQYPQWNQSGHTCPGNVRIGQIKQKVIGYRPPVTPSFTERIVNELPTLTKGAGLLPKPPNVFVQRMQVLLGVAHHPVASGCDGRWGNDTDAAFRAFQRAFFGAGNVDGVCGPNSWAALLGVK